MAHAGGRPVLYKTVEELQKIVDEYFEWCDSRLVQGYDEKENKQFAYISPAPYTMSGLARRLGMCRKSLINYENKDEFLHAIKEAREKVHEDVETRLMEKAPTGAIFNLKNNFDWKDKTETDFTSGGKPIPILTATTNVIQPSNGDGQTTEANQEN